MAEDHAGHPEQEGGMKLVHSKSPITDMKGIADICVKSLGEALEDHIPTACAAYGSYWMSPSTECGYIIFGRVFDRETITATETDDTMRRIDKAYDLGFRLGKAYTTNCPDGEVGFTHAAVMAPIEEFDFRTAEVQGWKLSKEQYVKILQRVGVLDDGTSDLVEALEQIGLLPRQGLKMGIIKIEIETEE